MATHRFCDMCFTPIFDDERAYTLTIRGPKKLTISEQVRRTINIDVCPKCAERVVSYVNAYTRGTK